MSDDILNPKDIILFKQDQMWKQISTLKIFINFLKYSKQKKPFRFSFVDKEGLLLNNLTLRENILLDSISNSLTSSKESQLKNKLKSLDNEYLNSLFLKLDFLDELPTKVDSQTCKIAALIKSMIQNTDYIFLNEPDHHLDSRKVKLLQRALLLHTKNNNQTIFISSGQQERWVKHATKIVTRGPLGEFIITPPVKKFNIIDQIEITDGHLNIYNNKEIKKSA